MMLGTLRDGALHSAQGELMKTMNQSVNKASALTSAVALAVAMGFFGCGHAKEVETPARAEGAKEKDGEGAKERKAQKAEGGARASNDGPEKQRQTEQAPAEDGEPKTKKNDTEQKVPIARSPGALMSDGAVRDMQTSLQNAGMLAKGKSNVTGRLDAPTEAALRKFQEKNDLPATGVPDRATARALGLDADELFKEAPK